MQLLTLKFIAGRLSLSFATPSLADKFARLEFFSRLLHSLSPDPDHVWRPSSRLDAEITGWPKMIRWERASQNNFTGTLCDRSGFSFEAYHAVLTEAMLQLTVGGVTTGGVTEYQIVIRNGARSLRYRLHSTSRALAALCVLYDQKPHPRVDLELNISREHAALEWPPPKVELTRTYGDPSKAADELRNEGWPRVGTTTGAPAMKVFSGNVNGQAQQMYQLLTPEQMVSRKTVRTSIPVKWRNELFKIHDFTCQICLLKYDAKLLEPDHRIPVIFQADCLTLNNYQSRLMTLCRYCNQQKRETTKRFPADYDWTTSPWAYPENFDLQIIQRRVEIFMKRTGHSVEDVAKMLAPKKSLPGPGS